MEEKSKKNGRGRKKGVPNKVTALNRAVITALLAEYNESGLMAGDFAELEPKDRLAIAEKLMQYCVPKMQAVAVDVNAAERSQSLAERLAGLAVPD